MEFNPAKRLFCHPEALKAFIAHTWRHPPVNVEISPTDNCNSACPWCFSQEDEQSDLNLDCALLYDALKQMGDLGVKAITWTGGGEPSVYPHLSTASLVAHNNNLKQGLFTNGKVPVSEDVCNRMSWIRVSITEDLEIPSTVAQYVKYAPTGVCLNVTRDNKEHISRLAYEARNAGAYYFQIRPALTKKWEDQPKLVFSFNSIKHLGAALNFPIVLTEYKWNDCGKPHGYPVCYGHHFVPFIHANGEVNVCGYHRGKDPFIFGNLHDHSFKYIWESDRRRRMVDGPDGVQVAPYCQHCCKNHEINKVLANLKGKAVPYGDFV